MVNLLQIYLGIVDISMSQSQITTIRVQTTTKERLENLGKKNQTFDEILRQVLDEIERSAKN